MSFYSGTQEEALYAYAGASTNLATFTTEDNLQKTYPAVPIPAGYFTGGGSKSRTIKMQARGQLGTTSAPTFTWSIRLLTSETWSAGGILLASTAALTAATTVTLALWTLEADITVVTESIGGASTVKTMGEVRSPLGLASPFAGTIPTSNTALTTTTVDAQTTYYLFISAACGTSNGSNLINMQQLRVYGEN